MLKLYITPGSPYARMARIAVLEKGLEREVEFVQDRRKAFVRRHGPSCVTGTTN